MLHPYAIVLLDGTGSDPVSLAGHLCIVLADLVLLVSALTLAVDAHETRCPLRANLSTLATLVAVQDLPLAVFAVADPARSGLAYRISGGHLLTLLLTFLLVLAGTRSVRPARRNPLLAGLLLGATVLAVHVTLLAVDPSPYLHPDRPLDSIVLGCIAVLACLTCTRLLRSQLPRQAATRLSLAVTVIFFARLWATVIEATSPPVATIMGVVLCSSLAATTSIAMLYQSLRAREMREQSLQHRAAVAEATVRHDREIAHEVRSAAAGIVAGVHLLVANTVPAGPRRQALKHMVDVEAARLNRRMSENHAEEVTELDLDELIRPLVVAQAALGHQVDWVPSGDHVLGRHDTVTEIINVLLTNAARHAEGLDTSLETHRKGNTVEIQVTDRGPGIAPDVRDRMFDWGVRSPSSAGDGIGLHAACRLAREIGGDLRYDEEAASRGGASFVVRLRSASPANRAHDVSQTRGLTG